MSTDAERLKDMASTSLPPVVMVVGADPYLSSRMAHELRRSALRAHPDAETIELDASQIDRYAFDEAVSPSLLSDASIVLIANLQQADDQLVEAMAAYCSRAVLDPQQGSVVIAQHEGGAKGRKIPDILVKAGAAKHAVPSLNSEQAKLNFALSCFERQGRRVAPDAAQQLVAVLGGNTGELAAMCSQLCADFDEDPIGMDRVLQYLTANAQVTGFAVADKAMAGKAAQAIIAMRSAVEQGQDPIALIGALALKLRALAKAAAVLSGTIAQAEANINPWVLKTAMRQLPGWTSPGLSRCIRALAWADEQSKTHGGDPVYALEWSISLIAVKGR